MEYIYRLCLLFIAFFVLFGCGEITNQGSASKSISNKVDEYIKYRDSIPNRNKILISSLYDSIGYLSMNWIAKYRIDPSPDVLKKGLNLEKIKEEFEKLSDENTRNNTGAHINFLIEYRDNLLTKINSSCSSFEEEISKLTSSSYYKETLISKDKNPNSEQEPEYLDYEKSLDVIGKDIENKIEAVKINFEEIKSYEDWNKEHVNISSLFTLSKNIRLLFLSFFLGSIIFNIVQYIRYRKKSEKIKTQLSSLQRQLALMPKGETNRSNNQDQPKSSKLSNHNVKNKIESAYQTMHKTLLQRYHRDCVGVQEVTYNTLLSDMLTEAQSKKFTSEQELASYISNPLDKHRMLLESDIKECIPQDLAIQQIHTSITVEIFLSRINTAIIPESDVRSKVQSLKQNLIDELPLTTTQEVLSGIIQDYKINIETHLTKMLQENLVFYFPFADIRGALSEDKKSKTKARDSALQLSLFPDDITKATFHLLLDQEQMMQAGIMSYDSLLLPICELKPENFNSSGTRIEEIGTQGGTMVLEDGKWRVKDKLPIKII